MPQSLAVKILNKLMDHLIAPLTLLLKVKNSGEGSFDIVLVNKIITNKNSAKSIEYSIAAKDENNQIIEFKSSQVQWCKSLQLEELDLSDCLEDYRIAKKVWFEGLISQPEFDDIRLMLLLENDSSKNSLAQPRQQAINLMHSYICERLHPLRIEFDICSNTLREILQRKLRLLNDITWVSLLNDLDARSEHFPPSLISTCCDIIFSRKDVSWRSIKFLKDVECTLALKSSFSQDSIGSCAFSSANSLYEKIDLLFAANNTSIVCLYIYLSYLSNNGECISREDVFAALGDESLNENALLGQPRVWNMLRSEISSINLKRVLKNIQKRIPKSDLM